MCVCNGRKMIKQGKKSVPCPYCLNEDRMIVAIKQAIVDAKKDGKPLLGMNLQNVLDFLPDYPVMACLEAEALDMDENFVIMIQDSFGVKPFGDLTYV